MTGRMTTEPSLDRVLPVDKPVGPTSHDVVARVRRALRTRQVGHTGTLDPFASGLLLLCIGRATRIARFLSGMDKQYTTTVKLGEFTDTDDRTGAVVSSHDTGGVSCDDVERALSAFRGDIVQTPPSYSARKVGGRRAYAMARRGDPVSLDPIRVRIDRLVMTRCEMPFIDLDIACSSGTYIRAIGRDLGAALGTGAHLTALRRTAVGPHDVADAIALDELEEDPAAARAVMITMIDALASMPRIDIDESDVAHIAHGRSIPLPTTTSLQPDGEVALATNGDLVAIAEVREDRVHPRKVFV